MKSMIFDEEMASESSLKTFTYFEKTGDVAVSFRPTFTQSQINEDDERIYVWTCQVRIQNTGDRPCKVKKRYWSVVDSHARMNEVAGNGIGSGEEPVIEPGESFGYTTVIPLDAASGILVGHFDMQSDDGKTFRVEFPVVSLDSPDVHLTLQ